MNNIRKIFQHYIDRFEYINEYPHTEYYKWQICAKFPELMQSALRADDEFFADALNEVKKCSRNIIDSYTQPFGGLVEMAGKGFAPEVRGILNDLYVDDGGDLIIRMEKIKDFFIRCEELLNRFRSGSHLYRQNSHSVSALLFLNDPDHHYMYKYTQSRHFADAVEFYRDWGSGDNIKLDVYHQMCDELVAEILACPELLSTDRSRFDGRLKITGGALHPDEAKHILAFDIMYCLDCYVEFSEGIESKKLTMKEKQLYLSMKSKAEELRIAAEQARADSEKLLEAVDAMAKLLKTGDMVNHTRFGSGVVESMEGINAEVRFSDDVKKMNMALSIGNGIVTLDKPDFSKYVEQYSNVLKRYQSIPQALSRAENALRPYEEYLV